jgi:hypothetical protein
MEVKSEYLKFFVETERRNGLTATDIHRKIVTAWGEDIITLRSVQLWCKSGKEEGENLAFTHRAGAGRPRSSRSEENVNDVSALLGKCPHLSVEEIADLMDISATCVSYYNGRSPDALRDCPMGAASADRCADGESGEFGEECLENVEQEGHHQAARHR